MKNSALLMGGSEITIGGTITINSTTNFPQIDFNSDGTVTYKSNGISGIYYTRGWYQAANFGHAISGAGSGYEIRLTPTVGGFALELVNTWVTLSSGTSWSRTAGNGTSTGTIEIRRASTGVVVGSCTLTLNDNA